METSKVYEVIGTIQFFGGDINQLEGGANQPYTAMYKLDIPKGTTIAQYSDLIAQLLFQHLQEQDDGSGILIGLTDGGWKGEITGSYTDMLSYCSCPNKDIVHMGQASAWGDVYGMLQRWTVSPEVYSGIYYICNKKEEAAEIKPIEGSEEYGMVSR